jgi:hypothetical protein
VPILPGVDVSGTPGWLTPVLLPVVAGADGAAAGGGGVAGETPGEPAAEPPGDDGGATCADAARVETASEAAITVVRSSLRRIRTSTVMGGTTRRSVSRSGIRYDVWHRHAAKMISVLLFASWNVHRNRAL